MDYKISVEKMNDAIKDLSKKYDIYAPRVYKDGGIYADMDLVRYGIIEKIEDIEFNKKSQYSSKETILPITERLLYFTEDSIQEVKEEEKGRIVFLRSCDLHGVKRIDEMYLKNGYEDYYYKRRKEKIKFILMECNESFESCFCVDMGTNKSDNYDAAVKVSDGYILVKNKDEELENIFKNIGVAAEVTINNVEKTKIKVRVPNDNIPEDIKDAKFWEDYNTRCIKCGRCNFVCPTCTCNTMQDIYYSDNGKVGERRRVWASCMVDGYTDVAGGGNYRKTAGERMRFKVLHKMRDYRKRNSYNMCVGCGRCEDICPEYISYIKSVEKLNKEG